MDDKTRAPIWYAEHGVLDHCKIDGVKCLRECNDTQILHSHRHSPEFGWKCRDVTNRRFRNGIGILFCLKAGTSQSTICA